MNELRLDYLLVYLKELRELNGTDYRAYSEIGECIKAVKEELNLGVFDRLKFDRDAKWTVLQAAKKEGAGIDEIDSFIVHEQENLADKIDELRRDGYTIFFVSKPIGVIDDNIRRK